MPQTKERMGRKKNRSERRRVMPQPVLDVLTQDHPTQSVTREMPLRSPNVVSAKTRRQAERVYSGGDATRREISRGKSQAAFDAENRYGRGVPMGDTLQRKARTERRRPRKVAASTGKPRTKLGRAPVRKSTR